MKKIIEDMTGSKMKNQILVPMEPKHQVKFYDKDNKYYLAIIILSILQQKIRGKLITIIQ